ncbi:MAG: hypothetical protein KBF93_15330 [Leptospiraceae bacterium]|nr:hypothetical protein [Leptospiraceae bacterium]
MKLPFHLYQKIRFRLVTSNEYYSMLFIFGMLLITLFGILSALKSYKWILWTGIFLEGLAIALSFFADNIDKLFGGKTK